MEKKKFDKIKLNKFQIKKILNKNNIKGSILNTEYLPFKKVLLKLKNKNEIFIIKICYDNYSIKLSSNEAKSYNLIKKKNLKFIKTLPFKLITLDKNYSITQIKYIDGKKGNIFDFDKFYKLDASKKSKHVSIKNYLNYKMSNYLFLNKKISKDSKIIKLKKKLLKIFNKDKIVTSYSHGDFVFYNTMKNLNEFYVLDLEFFNNKRNYLYDYLFWHLVPVLNYLYKLNNIVHINIILYLIKNFIKYNLLKKKLYIENLELYFVLFFFERILQLTTEIKLKNIDELLTKFHQRRNLKIINFYEKLLIYSLNKM